MRFAAAAIGNEEMACPAADREITNYDREITNQIVVDWSNHNVDNVRKIKPSLVLINLFIGFLTHLQFIVQFYVEINSICSIRTIEI